MAKQTVKTWLKRLTSPTPEDFKWLRVRANWLGATTLTILGLSTVVTLPALIVTIAPYILVACVAITGTSSFTKRDTNEEQA